MEKVPKDIPERDKPFILALILLLSMIVIGAYGVHEGGVVWDAAKDFLTIMSPLLAMALTFYFKKKTEE